MGKTTHAICPLNALVQYLIRRGHTPGLLFVWPDNKALTRTSFSLALDKTAALGSLSIQYTGVATSAKRANMSNTHLKAMGRWKVTSTYAMFDCYQKISCVLGYVMVKHYMIVAVSKFKVCFSKYFITS